jgi:hypothetical protein
MSKLKLFLLTLALIVGNFLLTPLAFAQQNQDQNGTTNFREVNDEVFEQTNPLKIAGSEHAEQLSTPGGIISRILDFAFPIAGLILFVMIVWGGFEMLMGAADKKSVDAGRQRITAAIIGFFLLFVSFWIIRVVETVLGIKIIF